MAENKMQTNKYKTLTFKDLETKKPSFQRVSFATCLCTDVQVACPSMFEFYNNSCIKSMVDGRRIELPKASLKSQPAHQCPAHRDNVTL